jgi:glutamyl-tRNA synthetase
LSLDAKASAIMADGGILVLSQLLPVLRGVSDWQAQTLESAVKVFAEATGEKLGKLAQPLRAALTGTTTSPGIFDVLDVLGREESLGRIGDQIR